MDTTGLDRANADLRSALPVSVAVEIAIIRVRAVGVEFCQDRSQEPTVRRNQPSDGHLHEARSCAVGLDDEDDPCDTIGD